jgi:hypothetical protein
MNHLFFGNTNYDISAHILSYLDDRRSAVRLSRVCKDWHNNLAIQERVNQVRDQLFKDDHWISNQRGYGEIFHYALRSQSLTLFLLPEVRYDRQLFAYRVNEYVPITPKDMKGSIMTFNFGWQIGFAFLVKPRISVDEPFVLLIHRNLNPERWEVDLNSVQKIMDIYTQAGVPFDREEILFHGDRLGLDLLVDKHPYFKIDGQVRQIMY